MGIQNYLIDGVSGTGKTSVAEELERRGFNVVHGDRVLAYKGDPETGKPIKEPVHSSDRERASWRQAHQLWDIQKVQAFVEDESIPVTFFCGGARNAHQYTDLMDGVFILTVSELNTLFCRMDERVARDPTDWGGKPEEKNMVAEAYHSGAGLAANGIMIDADVPLKQVVDEILARCALKP
jgi:thymidylate kinase